ncbi:hypothetical protein NM208_g15934 [Fusarium decemcellulare]|uniref:Uncharacterized protein n=1 Tax=Fusarium decemcellulare TaxID=57161 RepID=A0ACC1RBL5_9HYPO|nr:hypothetical protein NM208_g15934 [Fusarium decemcellulare]
MTKEHQQRLAAQKESRPAQLITAVRREDPRSRTSLGARDGCVMAYRVHISDQAQANCHARAERPVPKPDPADFIGRGPKLPVASRFAASPSFIHCNLPTQLLSRASLQLGVEAPRSSSTPHAVTTSLQPTFVAISSDSFALLVPTRIRSLT